MCLKMSHQIFATVLCYLDVKMCQGLPIKRRSRFVQGYHSDTVITITALVYSTFSTMPLCFFQSPAQSVPNTKVTPA